MWLILDLSNIVITTKCKQYWILKHVIKTIQRLKYLQILPKLWTIQNLYIYVFDFITDYFGQKCMDKLTIILGQGMIICLIFLQYCIMQNFQIIDKNYHWLCSNVTIGLGALCKRQISIYLEYKMECPGLRYMNMVIEIAFVFCNIVKYERINILL